MSPKPISRSPSALTTAFDEMSMAEESRSASTEPQTVAGSSDSLAAYAPEGEALSRRLSSRPSSGPLPDGYTTPPRTPVGSPQATPLDAARVSMLLRTPQPARSARHLRQLSAASLAELCSPVGSPLGVRPVSEVLRRRNSVASDVSADEASAFYLQVNLNFKLCEEGVEVEPKLYQPTPEGLRVLVNDFCARTDFVLRVHEKPDAVANAVAPRVAAFLESEDFSALSEQHPIGAILTFDQNHALPVFVVKADGQRHVMVFDSTAGGVAGQYWALARALPDTQVWLNHGTRQADNQSCITDAFEVMKQAFRVPNLLQRVRDKALSPEDAAQSANPNSRLNIRREPMPENFHIFHLPEELCFTAQRKQFITDSRADFNYQFALDGKTRALDMHLRIAKEPAKKTTIENGAPKTEFIAANLYLYDASLEHKRIIDRHIARTRSRAVTASSSFTTND